MKGQPGRRADLAPGHRSSGVVGASYHPPMPNASSDAEALLRRMLGEGARWRPGQLEAITALVDDRRRVLLVQRTGWGKSAVYFIATRLLRDRGAGCTLLISPLLALMRNQIDMGERTGVSAATINSSNRADWEAVESRLTADQIDLLLVSPERLNNLGFRRDVLPQIARRTGLLVVDEAHCISDWGHDFRPDYRRVARILDLLPPGVPLLCATATANDRVVADIKAQLGEDLLILRGTLDRDGLRLFVLDLPAQADRLAWLAKHVPELPGSGIVYCLTIADTERVASWLRTQGIDAVAYSGDTDPDARIDIEQRLLDNRVKVVAATSALGMGFDKPDLGFVVHYQSPGSSIAYYQQVGRAGRLLEESFGILLSSAEEADIQDYFIRTAFPPQRAAEQVVRALAEAGQPVTSGQLLAGVNVRRSRLEAMLKVLEVEGAVEHAEGGWLRTLRPWSYDADRVERVTGLRKEEQAAMRTYATTGDCLMELLRRELDDPGAQPCGRCQNCTGRRLSLDVDPDVVRAASDHLRLAILPIRPRKRMPATRGSPPRAIPPEEQLEEGRALSVYNDGGWGALVRRGKYVDGWYGDELVAAAADLIRKWTPDPPPAWITCVPSLRHPELVGSLAERLASRLGLPFHSLIRKSRETAPQKDMENSAQQVSNVREVFQINTEVPSEPALLVDDIIDSGWTLTVIGGLLRRSGSGPVYPFVLARAVSM